jgi:hypothetical protein
MNEDREKQVLSNSIDCKEASGRQKPVGFNTHHYFLGWDSVAKGKVID